MIAVHLSWKFKNHIQIFFKVFIIFRMSNILICGTPGTGKSTLAEKVVDETGWKLVNVGQYAKDNGHIRYFFRFTTLQNF